MVGAGNALASWYTTLVAAAGLHLSGLFRLTELVDHFGSIMSVAIAWGFAVALYYYLAAVIRGDGLRMSGNPIYDYVSHISSAAVLSRMLTMSSVHGRRPQPPDRPGRRQDVRRGPDPLGPAVPHLGRRRVQAVREPGIRHPELGVHGFGHRPVSGLASIPDRGADGSCRYINACAKGEECIPQTWDMAYEKWGWLLSFWNFAGVPFT